MSHQFKISNGKQQMVEMLPLIYLPALLSLAQVQNFMQATCQYIKKPAYAQLLNLFFFISSCSKVLPHTYLKPFYNYEFLHILQLCLPLKQILKLSEIS